jgi:hypothetical protein
MSNEHLSIESRLRGALGPDKSWGAGAGTDELASLQLLSEHIALTSAAPRRSSRPSQRKWFVIAMASSLIAVTGAAAASGVAPDWFGDDPAAPANKLDVLREPQAPVDEPTVDPATLSMRALVEPPTNVSGDLAFLKKTMPLVTTLESPDPNGVGELLPLDTNLRLLQQASRGGIGVEILAVPTTRGKVCHWKWMTPTKTLSSSCADKLDRATPVHASIFMQQDRRAIASGIAIDDVKSVLVEFSNRTTVPAEMGRNSFVWIGTEPHVRPVGLIVGFADGTELALDALGQPR